MKAVPFHRSAAACLLPAILLVVPVTAGEAAPSEPDSPGVADDLPRWQSKLGMELTLSRRIAIERLGRMGPAASAAVPDLARILDEDADVTNRLRAAWALGAIGEPPVVVATALVKGLEDPEAAVSGSSAMALAGMGAKVHPVLVQALDSKDPATRLYAAELLVGSEAATVSSLREILLGFSGHSKPEFRARAIKALAGLGPPGKTIHRTMLAALEDEAEEVRTASVLALAAVSDEPAAVEGVARRVREDPSKLVRKTAVQKLGPMGKGHPEALAALVAAFDDSDKRVRALAALSTSLFGQEGVSEVLVAARRPSLLNRVRHAALETLAHMGPAARPAISELINYLHDDPDWMVRQGAAIALGRIGDSSGGCLAALATVAENDPHEGARIAAAEALNLISSRSDASVGDKAGH